MRGPLLPEDGPEGLLLLDVAELDGLGVGPIEAGAERARLLGSRWETAAGIQPVPYLARDPLDQGAARCRAVRRSSSRVAGMMSSASVDGIDSSPSRLA